MRDPHRTQSESREANADSEATVTVPTAAVDETLFAEQSAIEIEQATKRFGRVAALESVSMTIPAGSFQAIVGPNGSGKTTLGRAIAGLCATDSGSVRGVQSTNVGFSFQRPRYYPTLTVRQNLAVFRRLTTDPVPDVWLTFLEQTLRLDRVADRQADAVSGGFKKKLDIAITLLARPSVVWLDEPLADIDELSERRLIALLDSYRQHGATVIVSTHNVDAFEPVLTRLTVMADGRLCRSADADTLSSTNPTDLYQDVLQNLTRQSESETSGE